MNAVNLLWLICLVTASNAKPLSNLTEIRGRLIISATSGSVFVRPSPLNTEDDCKGWLHLERSSDLISWMAVDYYYGTWKNFELKDAHPVSGVNIYRVVFFGEL